MTTTKTTPYRGVHINKVGKEWHVTAIKRNPIREWVKHGEYVYGVTEITIKKMKATIDHYMD